MSLKSEDDFGGILLFLDRISSLIGQGIVSDVWKRFPYKLFTWFNHSLFTFSIVCIVIYLKNSSLNITVIAKSNIYIALALQCLLKSFIISNKKIQIATLLTAVRMFRSQNISTKDEELIVNKYNRATNIFCRTFFVSNLVATLTITVTPLFFSPVRFPGTLQLPMVSTDCSPLFEVTYLYQIVTIFWYAFANGAIDGLFTFFLQEASLQLEVIQEKLTHLGERDLDSEEQLTNLHQIHMIHLHTNKFIENLNSTFSVILLIQFATSTYVITFIMVSVSQMSETDYGVYNMAFGFCYQIFLWSWFGEQTRSQMNKVVSAMYNNFWYKMTISARKSLVIMMSCNQKEKSLSTAGLFDLSLSTFLGIIKTAYSYYAVMKDANKS